MKANGAASGWTQFDPRTGHSAYRSSAPRPAAAAAAAQTPSGQPPVRPQSAYEYFKTSARAASSAGGFQSARKKQGFAPRMAGGDEPMARNTSAYTNVPKERPQSTGYFYESVPSPTTKQPTMPATGGPPTFQQDTTTIPELERTSSRYAASGGEKTAFSSSWFGGLANSSNAYRAPRSHSSTNPPSPTSPNMGRHRSASPSRSRAFSTSSSTTDSLDDEDDIDDGDSDDDNVGFEDTEPPKDKPRAVPKSRLRSQGKFADFARHNPGAPGGHSFCGSSRQG